MMVQRDLTVFKDHLSLAVKQFLFTNTSPDDGSHNKLQDQSAFLRRREPAMPLTITSPWRVEAGTRVWLK